MHLRHVQLSDPSLYFVFGSNMAGRHGKGAALTAAKCFHARYGIGEGPTGNSFAIPTKDASLNVRSIGEISISVAAFVRFARELPNRVFLVTRIGCGLAGYKDSQIAPLFIAAPENCILPESWNMVLGRPLEQVHIDNDIGMSSDSLKHLLADFGQDFRARPKP